MALHDLPARACKARAKSFGGMTVGNRPLVRQIGALFSYILGSMNADAGVYHRDRDAAAVYGLTDLSADSIAAALSDVGSQGAMFALLHPKRDLEVRAAAAGALRLSLGAFGGRQGAAAPPLSLQIAEVRAKPLFPGPSRLITSS